MCSFRGEKKQRSSGGAHHEPRDPRSREAGRVSPQVQRSPQLEGRRRRLEMDSEPACGRTHTADQVPGLMHDFSFCFPPADFSYLFFFFLSSFCVSPLPPQTYLQTCTRTHAHSMLKWLFSDTPPHPP
ncbi:Hypothetical predicted protein [Xyrichtys novacula]|uniref:Uncharacterized protein n=1 Tax=Xyrichtys novacula TaxID=13765 RepID=A0AAV1FI01_XYRNO|nr:Hypothetical predicted protein [Xyrichtys novacula]